MRIKNVFLSLSLFILLSASALAQSGETVSLQIIDTTGKVIATQTVAKDGSFNFDNLPSGEYRVKVRFPSLAVGTMSGSGSGAAAASYAATGRISTNVTTPKQTQGATFGEKVNAGLQSAGSNAQQKPTATSTNAGGAENATARVRHTIKMQMLAGSDFLKIEKATSGLKDTLKTQVRTANPGAVTVESWSWGTANNSIVYETENENKLVEGVDAFIKIGEKKSVSGKIIVGHVTVLK